MRFPRIFRDKNFDKFMNEVEITEMELKKNTLHMSARHPEFVKITKGLIDMFKTTGGTNYVAVSIYDKDLGQMEIILQRVDGKTPSQLNMDLKEKIIELEKKVVENEREINTK